jgi:hypothetical protein
MPPRVVSDVFETLGGIVSGTKKQAASDLKKGAEDLAEGLGLKAPAPPTEMSPAHNEEQFKKIEKAAEMRKISKYQKIQQEIAQLQKKREQELPAYLTGQPGFDQEKAIRQLEEGPIKPKEGEKKKEAVLPISVKRAQNKAERHRGASG